jgi:hypothetical protein
MSDEWVPMDVVARVREYTDRDGVVKGVWTNHGTLWLKNGEPSMMVLDSLPVPQHDEKSGRNVIKLSVFARKERDDKPAAKPKAPAKPKQETLDDDIPF